MKRLVFAWALVASAAHAQEAPESPEEPLTESESEEASLEETSLQDAPVEDAPVASPEERREDPDAVTLVVDEDIAEDAPLITEVPNAEGNIDPYGWPPGASRLRGLPLCLPGVPLPRYGNGIRYTCHPAFPSESSRGPNFALWVGVPFGANFLGTSAFNRAGGFDVEGELYAGRVLGFGFAYRFLATAPLGTDTTGDGVVDTGSTRTTVHAFGGGVRLRFLADEPTRRAWVVSIDAVYGLSVRPSSGIPSGPIAQVSLDRQVGTLSGPRHALLARIGLRLDQGLTSTLRDYRALLVTGRLGFEGNIAAPAGFDRLRRQPRQPVVISVAVPVGGPIHRPDVGVVTGVHLAVGLPFWRGLVEPRARVGYERLALPVTNEPLPEEGRLGSARRFLLGGVLRVRPLRWLHLDAGAGYRVAMSDAPARERNGAYVEGAVGAGYAGCGISVSPAVYYRWHHYPSSVDFGSNEVGFSFEVGFGSASRTFPGSCDPGLPGHNPRIVTLVPEEETPSLSEAPQSGRRRRE